MGLGERTFGGKRGSKMYRVNGINIPVTEDLTKKHIAKKLNIPEKDIKSYIILKKAVDARKKSDVRFVYSVAVETDKRLKNVEEYVKNEYSFLKGKQKAALLPRDWLTAICFSE